MKIAVNAILVAVSASLLGLSSGKVAHSTPGIEGSLHSRGVEEEHANYLRGELAESVQYIRDEIDYAKVVRQEFETLFARVQTGDYQCIMTIKRLHQVGQCNKVYCPTIGTCIPPKRGSAWKKNSFCTPPAVWAGDDRCVGCDCRLASGEKQRMEEKEPNEKYNVEYISGPLT